MDIDKEFDDAVERHGRIYAGIHSIEGRETFIETLRMYMRQNDGLPDNTTEEIIQAIIQSSKRHMN
jgi:hypothetical protein